MCTSSLGVPTHKGVLGERSTREMKDSLGSIICWEVCWWLTRESSWYVVHKRFWLTRKSLIMCGLLGKILLFPWFIGELVLILPTSGFYQLHGEVFLHNSWRVAFVPQTLGGALPWYCTLLGIWLMIWTHGWVSFVLWRHLVHWGMFLILSIHWDALRVHVSFTQLRVFL